MTPFEPSRRMQTLQDRFDGLANQISAVAREDIAQRLALIAAEFPGHEIEFYCDMGSRSVSVNPPLSAETISISLKSCLTMTSPIAGGGTRMLACPALPTMLRRSLQLMTGCAKPLVSPAASWAASHAVSKEVDTPDRRC